MNKLHSTKRTAPCQLCGNTTGSCSYSTDENLIFCKSNHDDDVPGFKYLGESMDFWGKYVRRRDDWDEEKYREHRERISEQEKEFVRQRKLERANPLSNQDRDKAIRLISSHLGLKPQHRKDLINRGLNDEAIAKGLFFSVEKGNNQIPTSVPSNLPGIKDGWLVSGVNGYAVIAFDQNGLAVGFQLRDEVKGADNKYRWAKGDFSSHLDNGELPLTVIKSETCTDSQIIYLTEGILKPYIASHKHGLSIAGAAGFALFASSEDQFEQLLGQYEKVAIAPDAGVLENEQLLGQYQKVIEVIKASGKEVLIAWWGQKSKKSSKDFDEIEKGRFNLISVEEWLKKIPVKKEPKSNPKGFDNSKPEIDLDSLFQSIIERKTSFYQEKKLLLDAHNKYNTGVNSYQELEKAYLAFKGSQSSIDDILDNLEKVNSFLEAKKKKLDIFKILPKDLATVITKAAKAANSQPHRYLLHLISLAATCVGSKVRVRTNNPVDPRDAWWSECIFHILDVSPTSNGKSVPFKAIFQPLLDIEKQQIERQRQLELECETLKENWELMSRTDRQNFINDPKVNPRLFAEENLRDVNYVIQMGNTESIFRTISRQQPKQGVFLFVDEFKRIYNFDQYKSRGGDAEEKFIESWNGHLWGYDLRVDRKNSVYYQGQTVNIFGGIQPLLVPKYLDTKNDVNGRLARILFTLNDYPEEHQINNLDVSCYSLIRVVTEKLLAIPCFDGFMSDRAYQVYCDYEIAVKNKGYNLARTGENHGLASYLLKSAQQVSRIALALHCIKWAAGLIDDDKIEEIDEETIKSAIYLMDFQISQFKLLQSINKDNEGLETLVVNILNKAKKQGNKITTREVIQSYRRYKIDTNQQGDLNTEMVLSVFDVITQSIPATIEKNTLIIGVDSSPIEEIPESIETQDNPQSTNSDGETTDDLSELLSVDSKEKAIAYATKYGDTATQRIIDLAALIPDDSGEAKIMLEVLDYFEGVIDLAVN